VAVDTPRIYYFRGIDSWREKANPPIDLVQPPLALMIVGVVAAIVLLAAQATTRVTAGRSLVSRNRCSSLSCCKPLGVMKFLTPTSWCS
jgi:hypothetical protein